MATQAAPARRGHRRARAADVRADAAHPRLRGAGERALPGRRRCRASPTSTSARRRWPSASARRCASDDYITSTHRGHGHCLAKGAAVDRMFCELLGKEAGYCRGKGGSMHIADHETGNLGANAIVGGSAGIATGAALLGEDARHRTRSRSASSATARSARALLYEVDEHGRALEAARSSTSARTTSTASTRTTRETTAGEILARAGGVRHPGEERRRPGRPGGPRRDDARPSSARAPARARRSSSARPTATTATTSATSTAPLPVARTRSRTGSTSATRSRLLCDRLIDRGSRRRRRCSSASTTDVEAEVDAGVRVRARRALPGAERGGRGCLSPSVEEPATSRAREIYARAGRQRGDRGGDAPRPDRLRHRRGRGRGRAPLQGPARASCRSSARSASSTRRSPRPGITGIGVGAAMTGMRPVVDIMFGDFITLTMDQMVNQAAKAHYMSGGKPQGADRRPHHARRHAPLGRPAQPDPPRLGQPRPRPQGGAAVDARTTPRA